MSNYLIHFVIYSLAMAGFIALALFVYKKSTYTTHGICGKNFLKVENYLKLGPNKIIYIIKAGSERFMIAGDAQSTTLISKLDETNIPDENREYSVPLKKTEEIYRG